MRDLRLTGDCGGQDVDGPMRGGGGGGVELTTRPPMSGLRHGEYILRVHSEGWSIIGQNGGVQILAPDMSDVSALEPLRR